MFLIILTYILSMTLYAKRSKKCSFGLPFSDGLKVIGPLRVKVMLQANPSYQPMPLILGILKVLINKSNMPPSKMMQLLQYHGKLIYLLHRMGNLRSQWSLHSCPMIIIYLLDQTQSHFFYQSYSSKLCHIKYQGKGIQENGNWK